MAKEPTVPKDIAALSFEDALMQDGIELRHITCGSTVPMYRTSIPTTAAACTPAAGTYLVLAVRS